MSPATAADTLSALSVLAHGEEQAHRYGPQTLRTVSHPCGVATLRVMALYDDTTEDRILLWATATLLKAIGARRIPVHIAYFCDDASGHRVRLTHNGAIRLLEAGDLPEATKTLLQVQDTVTRAQVARDRNDQSLFDSLNRIEREASDRAFLMSRRVIPRQSHNICGARPLGAKLSTAPDEARCTLPPYHLRTEQHLNARGERFGAIVRDIDRIEERRAVGR